MTGAGSAARNDSVSTSTRRPERNDSIDAMASGSARRPARAEQPGDTEITVWARLDTADPKNGTSTR